MIQIKSNSKSNYTISLKIMNKVAHVGMHIFYMYMYVHEHV